MSITNFSTYILIATLMLIPGAIWFEHAEPTVWAQRLALPTFKEEPSRHTPQYAQGTFLPPIITTDTILGPEDNPVLLTTTTRIASGATLTITAGTNIYAHEFAHLIVDGRLDAIGTNDKPITFTTNELNTNNQTWAGITINKEATSTINNAMILYASPAITCTQKATATITNTNITKGSAGVVTASSTCSVTNTTITRVNDGIIAINVDPQLNNTTITAKNQVRHYPQ